MTRPDLIESLCNIILEESDLKDKAKSLLTDLTSNKVSFQDALAQYTLLTEEKKGYWVDKLKSKVVYSALKKYQRGELSPLDTSKMISSLITHSIIEMQSNPGLNPQDLGIPELLELLSMSLLSSDNPDFSDKLNKVLTDFGYLN